MTIIGSGGHSKVIIDTILNSKLIVENIYDIDIKKNGKNIFNIEIISPIPKVLSGKCIIAIGNNKIRKQIDIEYQNTNWGTIFHISSIFSNNSNVNEGSVLLAGSIVQAGSKIGRHCIVNTNSSIDHDCNISDFVHISPSATLCGNVSVGEGTHVGAGSTIIQNINIGKWCIIGAGSVITKDIPDFSLVVGVPGKIIKILNNEKI